MRYYKNLFSEELDRLFNHWSMQNRPTIPTDIIETPHSILIELELPGFKKDNISVDVVEPELIISAIPEECELPKDSEYIRRGRTFDKTTLEIPFKFDSTALDKDNISAKFVDGILTVTVMKKKIVTKQITIE
jgi:HSP20 family molecular chaperone IbpA